MNHPTQRFVKAMYCGKPVTLPKADGEYLDYEVGIEHACKHAGNHLCDPA